MASESFGWRLSFEASQSLIDTVDEKALRRLSALVRRRVKLERIPGLNHRSREDRSRLLTPKPPKIEKVE